MKITGQSAAVRLTWRRSATTVRRSHSSPWGGCAPSICSVIMVMVGAASDLPSVIVHHNRKRPAACGDCDTERDRMQLPGVSFVKSPTGFGVNDMEEQ